MTGQVSPGTIPKSGTTKAGLCLLWRLQNLSAQDQSPRARPGHLATLSWGHHGHSRAEAVTLPKHSSDVILWKRKEKKKKGSHQQVERVSNSCAESRRAAEAAAGAGWRPPGDGRAGRGHPGPPGAFPGFQSRAGMRHWACCVCGVRTGSPRGRADWQGCAASPPGPHPGSATEGPPASAGQPPFLNPGSSSVSWGNGHPPCCRANHCRPGC